MAGGIGSRFWPYSRNAKPKQFLDILKTGRTLIQMTYDRFSAHVDKKNIFVVSNLEYKGLINEQLPDLEDDQILLEPFRRNTAPCIAYACYKINKLNTDAVITVTPSDHMIFKDDAFLKSWNTSIDAASAQDKLITIGLKPHSPEVGYGYIQYLETGNSVKKVKTFTEKPEKSLAEKFIESGDFVWNSGIFIWGVKAIILAFEESLPEMAETFKEASDAFFSDNEQKAVDTAYAQSTNISIDYGVMEHSQNVYVVLGDFGWSDLGSWNTIYELSEKDNNGNSIQANALVYDTKNTLISANNSNKLIVVQGLQDYLVTECDNVLLICKRNSEQKFRDFVSDVKEHKGKEFL